MEGRPFRLSGRAGTPGAPLSSWFFHGLFVPKINGPPDSFKSGGPGSPPPELLTDKVSNPLFAVNGTVVPESATDRPSVNGL
jgi:hypothetical protein